MNSRNSLRFRACRLCVLCALLYDAPAQILIFILSRAREILRLEQLHSQTDSLRVITAAGRVSLSADRHELLMVTTPTATADTRATRQQKHVSSARVVCILYCNNPKSK